MKTSARLLAWSGLLILLMIATLRAGPTAWTVTGSTGTVDETSVPLVKLAGASVTIKDTAPFPATVIVRYPVVALEELVSPFSCLAMSMRFRDNGGQSRVRMFLRRLEIATGMNTLVAALDSNDAPALPGYQVHSVTFFPHTFDFANFAYYVEVRLLRNTLAGKPALNVLQVGKEEC